MPVPIPLKTKKIVKKFYGLLLQAHIAFRLSFIVFPTVFFCSFCYSPQKGISDTLNMK